MSASGEGSTEPQAVRQSASRLISRKPGAFFMSLLLFALMGNKGADKTRPYKESAKIVGNFLHSCHLIHPEGASMVTLQTVLRMERQTMVVLRRHGVSVPGEVAVFVHQPDIDPRRAGLAVVAADTAAYGIRGAEGADQGIIFLRVGGLKKKRRRCSACSTLLMPGSTVNTPGRSSAYCIHFEQEAMVMELRLLNYFLAVAREQI